jgi:ribose 5-phosphate isomerase B
MDFMKVYLGSDHAGFGAKEELKKFLSGKGIGFEDLGTNSTESCDYPDYALKVARKVAKNKGSLGLLVCGTGTGTSITANKVKGIRSAQATNEYMAKMAREHNDANVLSMGARINSKKEILKMADVFLSTPFSNDERHLRRVKKMNAAK